LLSRAIEDQTDNDQPEKPDNVDGQTTHTDPASPALSKRGNYFSDCSEIHTAQTLYHKVSSGVHKILPVGLSSPISVYCDQTTDGGGWTVIQRRFDGSVDFNRPWGAFRYGFGSANGEYWLGLENMYRLTNQHRYTLYVQLEDWNHVVKYAKYSSFSVGSSSNYSLSVSGYSGTAGDGFSGSRSRSKPYLTGQPFSARDVDRDASSGSCANSAYTGGWWYKSCTWSALNGPYLRRSDYTGHSGCGIAWYAFGGSYRCYLKKSKMMVRPANFRP
ncbi:PREDICTED: angiopoietin-related protein 1-like, partial [Branchiostoma belcheri]|uniref:Angiopoietin-related protein 1-like n=1 Tax=Branchiostoma belcheri TaxID=7741 RepID=A0A6P5AEN7_BRABE